MITVYTHPTGLFSPAMTRIANALAAHCPAGVSIVGDHSVADVVVLYVIGRDAIKATRKMRERGQRYVVIQCCLKTSGANIEEWAECWVGADFVWSYYDLSIPAEELGFTFYYSPLGIDAAFRESSSNGMPRRRRVVTTGTVAGHCGEAIEEVWQAAGRAGVETLHVGPPPMGIVAPIAPGERIQGVSDATLAHLFATSQWVSGLRRVEGFELPAAEGLACGARPIMFDQAAVRYWYGGSAEKIPDGNDRITTTHDLDEIFSAPYNPVTDEERDAALRLFNWEEICSGFWHLVVSR